MKQGSVRSIIGLMAAGSILAVSGCSQQERQQVKLQAQQVKQQIQIQHTLSWSGDVDDTVTVNFQGAKAWVDDVTKKPVENTVAVFHDTLPQSPVTLQLTTKKGRGQVELIQQPTASNNYTAGVRIIDKEPSHDHYSFTLTW